MNHIKAATSESTIDTKECLGEVIYDLALEAGEARDIFIGIYEDNIEQPRFCVSPENESISAKLERIEARGEYTLMYKLKNLGPTTTRLQIKEYFVV